MPRHSILSAAMLALALAGCSTPNPNYDPQRSHHRPDGFVNSDPTAQPPPVGVLEQLWRMVSGYYRPLGPPAAGYAAFAETWSVPPERAFIAGNRDATALTWLGHASMLLQVDGRNLLIDPVFSDRASPLSWTGPPRRVPAPLSVAELPDITAVLISHNHYDHLDRPSVQALAARFPRAVFVVPLGLKDWMEEAGASRVRELDWWDSLREGSLSITLTPAQHWSKRTPWDRNRSLWGGFAVSSEHAPQWRFVYTGDTGYSADFATIRARLGPVDLAAVPVGAYLPRDFMRNQHVNPAEALQIVEDLEAREAIGVHWGTFELTQETFDAPPRDLAAALAAAGLPATRLRLLRHGETLRPQR